MSRAWKYVDKEGYIDTLYILFNNGISSTGRYIDHNNYSGKYTLGQVKACQMLGDALKSSSMATWFTHPNFPILLTLFAPCPIYNSLQCYTHGFAWRLTLGFAWCHAYGLTQCWEYNFVCRPWPKLSLVASSIFPNFIQFLNYHSWHPKSAISLGWMQLLCSPYHQLGHDNMIYIKNICDISSTQHHILHFNMSPHAQCALIEQYVMCPIQRPTHLLYLCPNYTKHVYAWSNLPNTSPHTWRILTV